MIPKKIHFTFSSDSLPNITKNNLQKWQEKHPDWEIYFYTDKKVYEFFAKYFPQYFKELPKIPLGAMLADLFRYSVLYIYGGLYSDIDTFPLKKIPEEWLVYKCVLGYEYQPSKFPQSFRPIWNTRERICQWTLLGAPNYPLYKKAVDESFLRLRKQNYQINDCKEVHSTSGPLLITEVAQPYLNKNEVLVLDADYFGCCEHKNFSFTDRSIIYHQFQGEQIYNGREGWVIQVLQKESGLCPFWKWRIFASLK